MKFDNAFWKHSKTVRAWLSTPVAILCALSIIILWALTGFYFHWSEAHSEFINTFTNVITFMMVFLIEYTQNRDTKAIQLKLNELIKTHDKTDKGLLNIEEVPEKEFKQTEKVHKKKGRSQRRNLSRGGQVVKSPVS